jgi:hypothetical protein
MSDLAAWGAADFFALLAIAGRQLRRVAYVLSGVLLAAVSARAEAPVLSQEFWNYMVEFDDGSGDVFDPSDYATLRSLPSKAQEELDRAAKQKRKSDEHSDRSAAPIVEEQVR